MKIKQAPTRIARFLFCAILAGWFAHVGRTQTAVFPPPLPGASSCSNPGANWLTCSISGTTLTLGAATGQTPHQVIGTCGSATAFGPCALVAGDLPSISLTTGVIGTLQAAQEPAHTGDMTNTAGSLATTVVGLNGTNLAGLSTGILMNTTGTGVPSIATASNFPTLNQNTTGTAANVTGVVAAANGGTGVNNAASLTLGTANQNWASLGTGIVKHTTTTGALSNAAA